MKLAFLAIAHTVLTHLTRRTTGLSAVATTTLSADDVHTRFPTIVAHTAEGKIMDGPRGLQLITPCGPTPVDATPEGFLAYHPVPHLLHPLVGRCHLFARANPGHPS